LTYPLALCLAALAATSHAAPETRVARVTAYCSACNTPRHSDKGHYGRLKKGDIAADKCWKPGTRIYIVGIGLCRVRDTGGAIRGRDRFDIYLGRHGRCPCNRWGATHKERYEYRRVR
jgi:3D (Asp-Asp-Asp) domain-containing protein